MWFPNRSYTNWAVQAQKQARSLEFRIKVEKELYYPSSENKGADQLRGYREADLRLCFRLCRLLVFPWGGSFHDVVGKYCSLSSPMLSLYLNLNVILAVSRLSFFVCVCVWGGGGRFRVCPSCTSLIFHFNCTLLYILRGTRNLSFVFRKFLI